MVNRNWRESADLIIAGITMRAVSGTGADVAVAVLSGFLSDRLFRCLPVLQEASIKNPAETMRSVFFISIALITAIFEICLLTLQEEARAV